MPEIIVKLGDNVVQKFFFVKESMSIGRGAENEIVIENLAISRTHATIVCEDAKYILTDLGSSNGTYVNGVKVKRTELMDKDVVTLGKHKLFFYDQRAAAEVRRPAMDTDATMLVVPTNVAMLTITKGRQKGQTFTLDQPATTLGKGAECNVQINDWFVSKQHAVIEKRNDEYLIRDLNSWRHTRVNGEVVHDAHLMSGDVIQLGPTVTLSFAVEASLRELEKAPGVHARGETIPEARKQVPAELAQANGHHTEDWVKQYVKKEGDPDQITAQEPHDDESEAIPAGEAEPGQELPDLPETEILGPLMPELALENAAQSAAQAVAEDAAVALADHAAEPERAPEPEAIATAAPEAAAASSAPATALDPKTAEEVQMWERALTNPSTVIRKQAARRLKALTGKDYDY